MSKSRMRAIIALGAGLIACVAFAARPAFADSPSAHLNRAPQSKELSEAERAVRERIRIHPRCPRAHLAYAQLLAEEGRNDEARRELTEAERLEPGLPFAPPASVGELARKLRMSDQLPRGKQTQWHF